MGALWSSLLKKAPPKKSDKPGRQTIAAYQQSLAGRRQMQPLPSGEPPLSETEKNSNLSELERKLNEQMVCVAGRNQVFIRSLVVAGGMTPPRIALKCPLRRDIGLPPEVYHDHIRDLCCSKPDECPAWQALKSRFVPT